jgi:MFS family permease
MLANPEKSAELVARLDRLPFSKWHRAFFIVAFLGILFDAADFALFGAALPPIAREYGLGPAQAGFLATIGLIGAFLGALFWGARSPTTSAVALPSRRPSASSPCSPA